ncbi:hypothetical protein J4730_02835 [Klebsiella pneumoniae]|uniref:Uncharacterized protein n=1 Tax=Klebsiella pneumoniae TaxID=573 RepID=A0A939NRT3_KLEPN|nr:hypothetical protein [Klebsiella pneumoniae]
MTIARRKPEEEAPAQKLSHKVILRLRPDGMLAVRRRPRRLSLRPLSFVDAAEKRCN